MNYHVCCFYFSKKEQKKTPPPTFFVVNIQELDWLAEMQQDVAAEVSLQKGGLEFRGCLINQD